MTWFACCEMGVEVSGCQNVSSLLPADTENGRACFLTPSSIRGLSGPEHWEDNSKGLGHNGKE